MKLSDRNLSLAMGRIKAALQAAADAIPAVTTNKTLLVDVQGLHHEHLVDSIDVLKFIMMYGVMSAEAEFCDVIKPECSVEIKVP